MNTPRRVFTALLIVGLGMACQKLDTVDVPTSSPNPPVPNLPSPQPGGTVILGLPATPTPIPPNTPTPSTTPATTPTPSSSASCTLAAMPEGSPCRAEAPSFLAQVETAQADVRRTRPDLF